MSFPRYPAYKDSGVEWLGKVPEHWSIEKFRYLFRESTEKISLKVIGEMLSVSGYRGIEVKNYDDENKRRNDEDLIGYRIVRPGQLVVNTMWLNHTGLGVSDHEGHVSPAYRAYFIDKKLDNKFIHHLLRSSLYVQGYTSLLTGIRPNSLQMSRDDLMNFPIVVPPRQDQELISGFLIHETAKIDALIAEQQRLIELLQEKRQAVISHAVTKGLNPDVPMKDSGVKWLGEVPEHWGLMSLKYLARISNSGCYGEEEGIADIDLPVATTAQIDSTGRFSIERMPVRSFSLEEISRYGCQAGDILVVKSSGSATNVISGKAGLVLEDTDNFVFSNFLLRARPRIGLALPRYLFFTLRSDLTRQRVERMCSTTTYPNLQVGQYCSTPLPLPPLKEQVQICNYIFRKENKLQACIEDMRKAIELLRERRQAVISTAVTGQIDLRGYQTQEVAA